MSIDHGAAMPVYLQLAAILRARIMSGELMAGRALPSETTLMQEHGIARETARKAVRVLRDEGLVEIDPALNRARSPSRRAPRVTRDATSCC